MRRAEIFWGGLLILLGGLFLLKAAGYLEGDVLGWFWPLFIIAVGVWILMGGFMMRANFDRAEKFSVPLQGAKEARLSIDHGMGHIDLRAGANAGDFLTGVIGVGMNRSSRLNGDKLEVKIDAGPSFIPFIGPEGGVWQYRLSPDLPLAIEIQAGASRLDIDLADLRASSFSFEGGASNLNLTLPARVENALVDIQAGAASIDLQVSQGAALRLRMKSVGSLNVDEGRFPRREGGVYQSADYDTARYRADVTIEGGATSVTVRAASTGATPLPDLPRAAGARDGTVHQERK
jgi:cell wall-active antibiotic response 4TMS protein YvqF